MELEIGIFDEMGIWMADWMVRGGTVLAAGLLVAWLAGRVRSSWGHVMMLGFLVAALAIPGVQMALPGIPVLPGVEQIGAGVTNLAGLEDGAKVEVSRDGVVIGELVVVETRVGTWGVGFLIWAGGAGGLLLRMLWGAAGLWWTKRGARRGDAGTVDKVVALALRAGIGRRVAVLVSERVPVAMTWGWLRPQVMLPADAEGWEDEKLEAVLLHELGHVKRGDVMWGGLAQLGCAVFWPTLVVFWAARRLEAEAERACDNFVVASGGEAGVYAAAVLEATALVEERGAGFARLPVVAMAFRGGKVEERVLEILDERRSRKPAGFAGMAGAVVLAVGVVLLGGLLEMRAAEVEVPPAVATAGPTVVLDAGHGGQDDGGKAGEAKEKDLALALTEKVKRELEAKGIRVVMTRSDDRYLSLLRRAAIANAEKDAVMVSLHFNTASKGSLNGIETYHWTTSEGSAALASSVHGAVVAGVKTQNRGVKKAQYAVLMKCKHPTVLVEAGFLSNAEEAKRIVTDEYQESVAKGVAEGVAGFLGKLKS